VGFDLIRGISLTVNCVQPRDVGLPQTRFRVIEIGVTPVMGHVPQNPAHSVGNLRKGPTCLRWSRFVHPVAGRWVLLGGVEYGPDERLDELDRRGLAGPQPDAPGHPLLVGKCAINRLRQARGQVATRSTRPVRRT